MTGWTLPLILVNVVTWFCILCSVVLGIRIFRQQRDNDRALRKLEQTYRELDEFKKVNHLD